MKHLPAILALTFFLVMMGCKKNGAPAKGPAGTPKVKTDGTSTYQYDTEGRRTQLTYQTGEKITYSYTANIVNEKNYADNGAFINESFHELNSLGFVQKTSYGVNNISRQTYLYNAAGQLINEHFVAGPLSDSSDRDYFYSPQGRLDSVISTRNNRMIMVYRQYYEYTETRPNTISHINTGLLFFGTARSVSRATKFTTVYPSMPQQVESAVYTYDNYNRIKTVSYNGGSADTYTYY